MLRKTGNRKKKSEKQVNVQTINKHYVVKNARKAGQAVILYKKS